ncbi:sialidase family protein [Larkinella ripae]
MKKIPLFLALLFCCTRLTLAQDGPFPDYVSVTKIWDQPPHSAFTDLVRFNNAFYCTFREGFSHVDTTNSGKVRVLKSSDGKAWESVALLAIPKIDLRDPKLTITPDKKLMVTMAGAVFASVNNKNKVQRIAPMVSFSDKKGANFTAPQKSTLDPAISPSKDWIWRTTWHNGIGYAIDYQVVTDDNWVIYLLKTKDGIRYDKVSDLAVSGKPNESTIRFAKTGRMSVLIRRESEDQMGVMAESPAPYTDWTYHKMDIRLGGPNFLFLNDQKLVIGSRNYASPNKMALFLADRSGTITKTIPFPSSGDASYPGMVIHQNKLWISYYSTHDGKSAIYLAQVPLDKLY